MATAWVDAAGRPLVEQQGAISGSVVNGRSGLPVAHAVVTLHDAGPGPAGTQRRLVTDSRGRYVFQDLPGQRSYALIAEKPAYFAATRPGSAANRQIAVSAGQWVSDVSLVLWPSGSISGTVTDERDEPVCGAPVRALLEATIGGQQRLAAGPISRTDDRGRYRIAGLPRGRYVVFVLSVQTSAHREPSRGTGGEAGASPVPSRPPATGVRLGDDDTVLRLGTAMTPPAPRQGQFFVYPAVYYPGGHSASAGVPVAVDYGDQVEGVDMQVHPVPGRRVSGIVAAPAAVMSGLHLRLVPMGNEGLGTGSEVATTTVFPAGRFTFLNVPAGNYTLELTPATTELSLTAGSSYLVSSERLPDAKGAVLARVASDVPDLMFARESVERPVYWAHVGVEVRDSDVSDVFVEAIAGSTLRGSLVLESDAGPPLHQTAGLLLEPALSNAIAVMPQAAVAPASDSKRPWQAARAFEFRGLTPGDYYLNSNADDSVIRSISWYGRELLGRPISIAIGTDASGVVVTMTTKVSRLQGYVSDRKGQVASEVTVVCFPVDREEWVRFGLNTPRIRAALADTAGHYGIGRLPAGDYYLLAVPDSRGQTWLDPTFLASAVDGAVRVSVGWNETKEQNLRLRELVVR